MQDYDVIILGAGPAGLSIASEISKRLKVLVIEKEDSIKTTKAWTSEYSILKNAGLEKYVKGTFLRSYIKSFANNKFYIIDKGATVDEHRVLKGFEDKIRKNKGKILFNTSFQELIRKRDHAIVKTNNGIFRCKLVIDCLGYGSPLVKKFRIFQAYYYCMVYGEIIKDAKLSSDDITLCALMDKEKPNQYFELFPYNKDSHVSYTFIYSKKAINPLSLESVHKKNKRLWGKGIDRCKIVKKVYGIVPMGTLRTNADDRIFFFGDTALIGAPTIASGFTNIIQHYKRYAVHIMKCIESERLSKDYLEYKFDDLEALNRNILFVIGMIFAEGTPKQVDRLVDMLKVLPNKILIDVIFLKITIEDIQNIIRKLVKYFSLEGLAKILPKKEYSFFASEAAKIIEEITVEEADKIFKEYRISKYKKGLITP